ncbi:MAG: DNA primase, partial [Actinobacteria bacterium]|nr:DNA primase [Actinomycetota bacterium]
HLTFTETIEKLAERIGYTLTYDESRGTSAPSGQRSRLVAANAAAAKFYQEQLSLPTAQIGRDFLIKRGFDQTACAQFGVGYAPDEWDALTKFLRAQNFTIEELNLAGLSKEGQRGPIDRFRNRLVWPIRDISGDVVGFGARKLASDEVDQGPKYLNTPETPIYKKSQVLYGLDMAKKEIAKKRQAVIVEGYTDVMAAHLAGVTTAVATCGTAFGDDHIRILRRLLMDDDAFRGEVIFTFDGDAAGQKAALRAFDDDQKFVVQTFVAVEPSGMDPCELRQEHGDVAVRDLIARRVPLFEFAIKSALKDFDLTTAEGRVQALGVAAPLVAKIRDASLRPEYARSLAG